jgi:uncharacterized protein
MLKTLKQVYRPGDQVVLHGAEPFALPIEVFKSLIRGADEIISGNSSSHGSHVGLQSSGAYLQPAHLDILKKYHVGVGISIDGPPELNILRGPRGGDLVANDAFQEEVQNNFDLLRREIGPQIGTITVLSSVNAIGENLETLGAWVIRNRIGGRFNPMFVPHWMPVEDLDFRALTNQELAYAWSILGKTCYLGAGLIVEPVTSMFKNLLGSHGLSPCIFSRCDYIHTPCISIMSDGSVSRCDRTFQDGVYSRAPGPSLTRANMLKQTSCYGCKYWEVCGGGCPGETPDFRQESGYCGAYLSTYSWIETLLRRTHPGIRLSIDIPDFFDNYNQRGVRINISTVPKVEPHAGPHHKDSAPAKCDPEGHLDVPHSNFITHLDSNDPRYEVRKELGP